MVLCDVNLHFSGRLTILLLTLFIFSVLVGTVIFKLSGFQKCYDSDDDRVTNEAQNSVLLTVSNYIFYTIPLLSTVFYLLCFLSLRSKRSLVRTEKTMELLDNAEKSTLKQGIAVVLFYLVSVSAFTAG
ncbi:hypothetical protein OESDEN_00602 [Oesophagostomum dentatum]|uniref:Uncharacterized protein n=1 Tax=Oesophagostomum dentatum TaxID=61180 RepID=A0A0B1TU88_OESDE|nr:hypothetical protein OESDEN_00602 [Oesophagostomum dentatum]